MYGKTYDRQKPGEPIKASTINRPLSGLEALQRARFVGRLRRRSGPGGIPLVDDGGTPETVITVRTPSGGIPAMSGTTAGSATCTMYVSDGATQTLGTETVTVYNDFPTAATGSRKIKVHWEGGVWRLLVQSCS